MGLIKAVIGSVGGVLADQWKEYFYCDAMPADILVTKGQKRVSGRSANTKGSENIISNGSVIAVNEGQCMMIVEQGKVVDLCAEPGEYKYDTSTEPSIFTGNLGTGLLESLKTIGKRFTFGGDTAKDQRVYFFNTKEIMGNKFGTPTGVPFRVVDRNIGLDTDVAVRCNGQYSYQICDPVLFYAKVCGNVTQDFSREEIDSTLKSELINALQPAFGAISEMGIRYSSLPTHTKELTQAIRSELTQPWAEGRGIQIGSVSLNSATISEEDQAWIKDAQRKAMYRNPGMAGANLADAQAEALKAAASNANGAMMGFMGMNMTNNMAGNSAQSFFQMQQQADASAAAVGAAEGWTCACGAKATGKFCPECGKAKPVARSADTWTCACGNKATGKFCPECGKPRPAEGWTCSCGAVNKGKFCGECGKAKPAGAALYKCDKCGWEPEDPAHPPKFCPECGDLFDDRDIQ